VKIISANSLSREKLVSCRSFIGGKGVACLFSKIRPNNARYHRSKVNLKGGHGEGINKSEEKICANKIKANPGFLRRTWNRVTNPSDKELAFYFAGLALLIGGCMVASPPLVPVLLPVCIGAQILALTIAMNDTQAMAENGKTAPR